MSNTSFSMYNFKPFQFKVLKQNRDPFEMPLSSTGHTLFCNDAYMMTYVGPRATACKLWQYYFDLGEWRLITSQNMPPKLGSVLATLFDNIIIIFISWQKVCHSGECTGFGLYLGDLASQEEIGQIRFQEVELSNTIQIPNHSCIQALVINGTDIFLIHGTMSNKYGMGVFQLDVMTRKWEVLYPACHERGPITDHIHPRNVIFYNGRIYVFASGFDLCCKFSEIHMFDLATRLWYLLKVEHNPRGRRLELIKEYSCVQCPINRNLVYVCGGCVLNEPTNAIWRFDLNTLQCENLTKFNLPQPIFGHRTIVTPSGRMYCFSGRIDSSRSSYSNRPYNNLTCAWITIPKLKILSWEAMVHYFKDQMFESSIETLKKIGIPPKFYNRIIEARRHINNV